MTLGNDLSPKTLRLLPGLDGTGNLFTNILSALPPTLKARIVRYPTDRFLTYTELSSCVGDVIPTAEPFVVLAESFSTPLAVRLAATRPPNPAGLVICAGFITNPLDGWLRHMKALVRPSLFRVSPPGFIIDYFLIGARAPHELRDAVRQTLRCVSPEVLVLRVRAVIACDAREELVQVRVPILYLQAKHDRLVKAPMDRLTTNRRDKASLSGPRCTRFQYQTGPSIPAHRRKCGLADCWESSACKFR